MFLCFFGLRDPRFRAFRAQDRGFCALLRSGTPVFWLFEHKIGVFVRFLPSGPPFSGVSSTKSAFLCSGRGISGIGKAKEGVLARQRAPRVDKDAVRARQRAPRGRQPAPRGAGNQHPEGQTKRCPINGNRRLPDGEVRLVRYAYNYS